MSPRTLWTLLFAGFLMLGCPEGDDDDTGDDDDSAGDDDAQDDDNDDTGDDDASCAGISPPGYAGSNGFAYVLEDGTEGQVENQPYEHEISTISSGLAVSTDNGDPPEEPIPGEDYVWTTFSGSPYNMVTAGEQPLQADHTEGARLTLNVIPDFPDGVNDQRTYAVNPSFPVSGGTANCQQAPNLHGPFQCSYDALLVFTAQDEQSGEAYIAGCTAISGAFDTTLQPAS